MVRPVQQKSFYQQVNTYIPSKQHLKATGAILGLAFVSIKLLTHYFSSPQVQVPIKPIIRNVDCRIGKVVDGVL